MMTVTRRYPTNLEDVQVDIRNPAGVVEMQLSQDRRVIWIHVSGYCVLRIQSDQPFTNDTLVVSNITANTP